MPKPNVHDKIFEAALKLLPEKGFNGCSVQDITVTAGVPKGPFYNHFASEDALGAAIVEYYGTRAKLRAVLTAQSLAPVERERRYFVGPNEMIARGHLEHACLLGNL